MIANRLKSILPKIIYDTQSAFLLGCQITNNFLVTYALVHFLKMKKKGKKGYMSLKFDMSKAYDGKSDRIEWTYLEKVMETLGFTPHSSPLF